MCGMKKWHSLHQNAIHIHNYSPVSRHSLPPPWVPPNVQLFLRITEMHLTLSPAPSLFLVWWPLTHLGPTLESLMAARASSQLPHMMLRASLFLFPFPISPWLRLQKLSFLQFLLTGSQSHSWWGIHAPGLVIPKETVWPLRRDTSNKIMGKEKQIKAVKRNNWVPSRTESLWLNVRSGTGIPTGLGNKGNSIARITLFNR